MNKQEKAKLFLRLIFLVSGAIFICLGIFWAKALVFLHSYGIASNLNIGNSAPLKYALIGIGIMDVIGSFIFPKYLDKTKS